MQIAINANEANVSRPVGSNVFARQTINAIYKLDKKNKYQVYLKNPPLSNLPPKRKNWSYHVFGPKPMWTQLALSVKTIQTKPDLLFSPGHYGAAFCPAPQIVSIMDLAYEKFSKEFRQKDLWQLRFWTRNSVMRAKKVIAISESTKKDLMELYQTPSCKIKVIYPGSLEYKTLNIKQKEQREKEKYLAIFNVPSSKFLLFIGTLQPRKNIRNLILAYKKLLTHMPQYSLVLLGKKGWLYDDVFKLVKKLKLENKVIFMGYVSDEKKVFLLAHAECLVFPSLYEGFGFPILEAYQASCPVVCSHNSSLPELAGKAAIYIKNENNPDSIAKAIVKMLKLPSIEKERLKKRGQKRLKSFSWEKTAGQMLDLFENINKPN